METNGRIGLIVLDNFKEQGKQIDLYLSKKMQTDESSIVDITQTRFSNGEAKLKIESSVRGRDVFILCDIGNYSLEYKMYDKVCYMSPDDHFCDLKRAICAIAGKASRITVIMPLLYASRQDKRNGRESLDCAMALKELEDLGVDAVITFDAHNPNIQNAIPHKSFDNMYANGQIVKAFLENEKKVFNGDELIVISPDTGAMERAIFHANMLSCDVGMFYKRRDFSVIIDGKNPIVEHVYTGKDVAGKTVIVVDDMIASGESIIDVIHQLSQRKAKNIFVFSTFAFFTHGLEKFNVLHKEGKFNKIYSTNLTYTNPALVKTPWFYRCDLTQFIADVIEAINNDKTLSPFIESSKKKFK